MNMKKMQKGFTLIELMIVIAIIAILAAIAIPAYQHYIARAQASEALTITSGLKTDIINYWDQNGAVPASSTTVFSSATNMSGKYVAKVAVAAGGEITATMKATGVSKALQSANIYLTPYVGATKLSAATATTKGAVHWKCESDKATSNPDDLPSQCRNAQ